MKSENDVQYTVISPEGKLDTKFLPERVIVTLQTPPQYFLFGEEGPTAEVELSREGELIEQRWLLGGEPREYSPAFDDYFPLSRISDVKVMLPDGLSPVVSENLDALLGLESIPAQLGPRVIFGENGNSVDSNPPASSPLGYFMGIVKKKTVLQGTTSKDDARKIARGQRFPRQLRRFPHYTSRNGRNGH